MAGLLQRVLVACALLASAVVAYSPRGVLPSAAVDAGGNVGVSVEVEAPGSRKRKLVRASAESSTPISHAAVAVGATGAMEQQGSEGAKARQLAARVGAPAAIETEVQASIADSCIAKCGQRRSECRAAAQVEGFKLRTCMAPCHASKHACTKSCGEDAACRAACSGPHTACRASCKESLQLSQECHSDTWRACRRVCIGDAVEATRGCKHSCATRGDSCVQMSGVGSFERSGCATECSKQRKQCREGCSSDACHADCAVLAKSCAYVCKMKVDATKTCRSKVSNCVSNSCQPKLIQALQCKQERSQCCEKAGVAGCSLDSCWSECKNANHKCQTECAGDKACRRQCRSVVKECRGACHTGRVAKRGCWSAWSTCLGVSTPKTVRAASLVADGAEHHDSGVADELDEAEHGAAEAEEDMHEDEEWLALEEMELGEDAGVENVIADEVTDDAVEADEADDYAAAVGNGTGTSGASAAMAQLNVSNVKTVVGCPTGNGMQKVGNKWVTDVPEKCFSVSADSPQQTAGVRCCHESIAALPMKKYGACNNLVAATYQEAVRICSTKGLRVCTLDELWSGRSCKTGCGLDRARVWTATPCDAN